MPIRLDKIPSPALRPEPPRAWLWFSLLVLFLLLGIGGGVMFSDEASLQRPAEFWFPAIGIPFLGWCVLGFGRLLFHVGEHSAADGWDEAREKDMSLRVRQGRRSQQVLVASLYTALRAPGEPPTQQLDKLLDGVTPLKSQPSRQGGTISRHTLLSSGSDGDSRRTLLRILKSVLADLAPMLAQLSDDQPLALLLEIDTGLPEEQWRRVWRRAWRESGIRQSSTSLEVGGLAALDHWLDHRVRDQALLLVVALQFAPQQPEGTAEVAVGLLFGNRLTQATLPPIAYLHRPEQERKPTTDDLFYATRQALDWVPVDAKSIEQVWRVGIDSQRQADIASVMTGVPMGSTKPGVCNLDASLGFPGCASPWMAIAAATQTVQRGTGPHFIFSGRDATDGLWGTVLMPVVVNELKTTR
ncbi:Structural protein [Pseudomonas sp. IT-P258]|uniref:hypothetical protein n=1 Tax=Pseudomonas sp. IT-P258 TaxID=3026447 RepID=UPI0039E08323